MLPVNRDDCDKIFFTPISGLRLRAYGSNPVENIENDVTYRKYDATYTISSMIQKQAKNRNETGSNLSLGTRLTVLSKRLGRKRCCDTTPDRCLECNRLTILTAHC